MGNYSKTYLKKLEDLSSELVQDHVDHKRRLECNLKILENKINELDPSIARPHVKHREELETELKKLITSHVYIYGSDPEAMAFVMDRMNRYFSDKGLDRRAYVSTEKGNLDLGWFLAHHRDFKKIARNNGHYEER